MKVLYTDSEYTCSLFVVKSVMDKKSKKDETKNRRVPGKSRQVSGASTKHLNNEIKTIKVKEPQFVPYEPYKAAVNPIFKSKHIEIKSAKAVRQNPNVNIQEILTETTIPFPLRLPSPTAVVSPSCRPTSPPASPKSPIPLIRVNRRIRTYSGLALETQENVLNSSKCTLHSAPKSSCWNDEKIAMENEIMELKRDKAIIESQLQTQTQVNAELKKLLVASVGEDIQQRVQFLTEDKARLAEDIVNYSQRLISDYEELQKLSIQCDVWRSKYMASSVMVDELAKWKALLSRKFEDSRQIIDMLLVEHTVLREQMVKTNRNLLVMKKSFDPTSSIELYSKMKKIGDLNSLNIIQLAAVNLKLAEQLKTKLLGDDKLYNVNCNGNKISATHVVTARTQSEEYAFQILTDGYHDNSMDVIEFPQNAKFGLSSTNCRGSTVSYSCCSHCSGDIKQV